ncbi:MAG: hypothetical protein ABIP55_12905, partial [Tepidisphaeraceae bacterium]
MSRLVSASGSSISIQQRRRSALRWAVLATPAVAALALAPLAHAVPLYFDADGQEAASGGSGQWDGSLPRWATTLGGSTYTNWTDSNDAFFTSGTIDVTGPVSPAGMHFTGDTYIRNSTGTLTLASSIIEVNTGASAFFLTTVAGAGIIKTGGGTVGFYAGGASTPTGLWDIQAGTVVLPTNNTGLTSKAVAIAGGATLDIGHSSVTSGALSGAGSLVLGTQVQLGTITGARFSANGDGSPSSFSGVISGVGRFQKNGTGTLTLSGVNTFSGHTTASGTLIVQGGNAIPDAHPFFTQGGATPGTLLLNANETVGSISGSSVLSAGALNPNGFTLSIGADNNSNAFAGRNAQVGLESTGGIFGSGLIRKVGTGAQVIGFLGGTTATSYTGKWEVANGILAVCPSTNAGVPDAFLGAVPGAADDSYITLSGGTFAGALTNGGSATYAMSANRGITVTANSGLSMYSSGLVSTLTVNGKLTGSANLNKAGSSVVNLNNDNTASYTGDWNVTEGAIGTTSGTAVGPLGTGSVTLRGGGIMLL